jgi:S-(hydroxymethyl)glutathione dehydrogenase / alcohol dehydrogenase
VKMTKSIMKIKHTKAAILVKQNKSLEIDNITMPKALDYGQVLVEVHYSGICGSQIGEITGVKGEDKYLPHLLGHEGSGVVLETGPNVTRVKKGDNVVMHWRPGNGIQSSPPKYLWKNKQLNAGFVTTFNQHAVVSENRLTSISKDIDLEIASLFGCAVTTGLGVVNNDAKLKIGESIVIFGAGGIGLNLIQGSVLSGAYPIIAIDLYDNKLKMAKSFGATHVINSNKEEVEQRIKKILKSNKPDVVVDNTGVIDVINQAYNLTSETGRTVLVGVPRKGETASIHTLPLHFQKKILGSEGGSSKPDIDIPNYLRLHKNKILNLEGLITAYYSLDNINSAIKDMREGVVAGRVVISMR